MDRRTRHDRLSRSLPAFQRCFPDEAPCVDYLAAARWPDDFRCLAAGEAKAHSNGISPAQLQFQLGLGSYKTTWLLCAKPRRAMVDPERNPLTGVVGVDDTTIPFRTKDNPVAGGAGRSPQGKMPVIAAVAIVGNRLRRVRLAPIADYSNECIRAFAAANIAAGATLKTDGWAAYPGTPDVDHDLHVVDKMAAHLVLPWTHQVFANLKRWALSVYHGLRRNHFQSYFDDFTFRFNRRRTRHAAFRSPHAICFRLKPITCEMLISPEAAGETFRED